MLLTCVAAAGCAGVSSRLTTRAVTTTAQAAITPRATSLSNSRRMILLAVALRAVVASAVRAPASAHPTADRYSASWRHAPNRARDSRRPLEGSNPAYVYGHPRGA